MTGDLHAVTPSSRSAVDSLSAAERLARAAAVLAEAEASAAARAAETAAETAAGVTSGAPSAAAASAAGDATGADDSSVLGVAWVDHPADLPAAASFAELLGVSATDTATGSATPERRRSGTPAASGGGRRDRGRRGRRASGSDEVGSSGTRTRTPAGPEPDPESVARGIVLRQLSMAPRSRSQLERKLSGRGCDDAVAARVLDRMTQVGLVDDEAYAQMLVRVRHTDRGLARRALSHELRRQGIDQELAEVALRQVGDADERLRAEQLVEKRLRSLHGLTPEVQSRRLAGLLARKGYSNEIAYPVIRDAVANSQEHCRD